MIEDMAGTDKVPVTECKFYIPKELFDTNVEKFVCVCSDMCNLYAKKNHDYGNAFGEIIDEVGTPYGVGKLKEKLKRIETLISSEAKVNESIEDSLIDLGCYSIMTLLYLKRCNNGKS